MMFFIEIVKNWNRIAKLKKQMASRCLAAFDKYEESDSMSAREHLIIDLHDIKSYFAHHADLENKSCLSDELYHLVVEAYFTVVLRRCQLDLYNTPGDRALIIGESCMYDTHDEEGNFYVEDTDDIRRSQDIPRFSNFLFLRAIYKCRAHSQESLRE